MPEERAMSVLIAQESVKAADALKAMLQTAGFQVFIADAGKQVVKIARLKQPDVIILDRLLGQTSGFEVCKGLKKDADLADIPVLLSTMASDVENKIRALNAGAIDVLSMPFDADDVTSRLMVQASRRELTSAEPEEVFTGFLQSGSHDLRTPLTAAKTYIHLLKKASKGGSSESYLNKLDGYIDEVSTTLNHLYTLSNLDGIKELKLMPHAASHILEYATYSAGPLCHAKEITLRVNLSPQSVTILADEGMLHQALFQVLSNAIAYTPAGGHVTVSSKVSKSKEVVIEVSDDGIGIERHDLPHIFKRFYRVGNGPAALVNGAGLGLAITKRIIDLHHGTITAESEPFEFTTIRITLPIH